jgi:hypothetical protein
LSCAGSLSIESTALELSAVCGEHFIGQFGISLGDCAGDDLCADQLAEQCDGLIPRPTRIELGVGLLRAAPEQGGDGGEVTVQAAPVLVLGLKTVPSSVDS